MVIASNNKITIVRGDTGSLDVTVTAVVNGEEVEYELEEGDTLTFRMSKQLGGTPLIEKEIEDGELGLLSSDTASLPFGDYYYDITFVSSDESVVDHIIQATAGDPNFIITEAV